MQSEKSIWATISLPKVFSDSCRALTYNTINKRTDHYRVVLCTVDAPEETTEQTQQRGSNTTTRSGRPTPSASAWNSSTTWCFLSRGGYRQSSPPPRALNLTLINSSELVFKMIDYTRASRIIWRRCGLDCLLRCFMHTGSRCNGIRWINSVATGEIWAE